MALDQSSKITGYSIFDNDKLVKCGIFSTTAEEDTARFIEIKQWFVSMLTIWRPDHVGIEGIQFQEKSGERAMGVTVFQTLARLQGILMLICAEQGIPLEVCTSNTWRHTCGVKGKSRADKKKSAQLLVKQWYGVTVSEDEADAIGLGRHLSSFVKKNTEVINWET